MKEQMMEIGSRVPDGTLLISDGTELSLAGQRFVLYFYPKADTPGCTSEAQDFSALMSDFNAIGVKVIGVSRDTPSKLAKFSIKYDLGVILASDEGGEVSDAFGTWVEKSMYGKSYMGMERATFLIDGDGTVRNAWRKVKVKGHAAEVLTAARALYLTYS
jgi:thioredoxin-dependent peroxiredoxin